MPTKYFMLSKNKTKYIRSLELKKNRKADDVFIAEGHKVVNELLGVFPCPLLVATPKWLNANKDTRATEIIEVNDEELSRASLQKAPQDVLAVFKQPHHTFSSDIINNSLCLALDNVQDPGNLGTIVRIADWFGIKDIFCSEETADIFNPKTVQATMGAIARVRIHYCNLLRLIKELDENTPVFGTFLDGENLYKQELSTHGLIVMGNEGNGISKDISAMINRRLLIPNYPQGHNTSESLNVAVATAIICAEFRRRISE